MKLTLFIKHIDERKPNHFLNCKKIVEEAGINFVWQNTKMKSALIQLQTEFENWFADFKKISHKMEIFENPFAVDIDNVPNDLQMNVILAKWYHI